MNANKTSPSRPALAPRGMRTVLGACALLITLSACNSGSGGGSSDGGGNASGSSFEVTTIGAGTYTHSDGKSWNYELLRVPNAAGGSTYLQWFGPTGPARAGVVVLTVPYSVIDWTGEAVDIRWAGKPADLCPPSDPLGLCYDEYGPNYVAGGTPTLGYDLLTPDRMGHDMWIYLSQGFAVLAVYGRYYSGGDVWNDVQDAAAGFRFLDTRTDIDKSRIGVYGMSWGGFETLYGSAHSPNGATPKVAVAIGAPGDFAKMMNHVRALPAIPELAANPTALAEYQNFYNMYQRRILVESHAWPGETGADYSRIDTQALTQRLRTRTLLMHDEWDTMIPYQTARELHAAAPTYIEGFWYQHLDGINYVDSRMKLSHGAIGRAIGFQTYYTFMLSYLFTNLGTDTQPLMVAYDPRDMRCILTNIRDIQRRGANQEEIEVRWLVPRLLELADARVTLVDVTSSTTVQAIAGNAFVAAELNAVWGTTLAPQTVADYLRTRGTMPAPGVGAINGCEIP